MNSILPPKSIIITVLISIGILGTSGLFMNCELAKVSFNESREKILSSLNASFIEIEYGNEFTNRSEVRLDINSTLAVEMYITNNPGCQGGGSWEKYKESRMWNLGSQNAETFVYILFKNKENLTSDCIQDSIVHDDVAPIVTFHM